MRDCPESAAPGRLSPAPSATWTGGIKIAALHPASRRPSPPPALARDRNSLAGLSRIDGPGSSGDVTPVAEELIAAGIPFLISTGVAVPLQLRRYPGLPVFRKPVPSSRLIRELAGLLPI